MDEHQIAVEEDNFCYRIDRRKVEITGYVEQDARIEVPSRIEGYPVSRITRKAFLNKKDLYSVALPESIEEIGDWAFANCVGLTEISLPKREVRFGRAVFKNCGNLKRIVTGECTEEPELLAATVTLLDAYYLLDLPAAGSADWLGKWDNKLSDVLRSPDQEGYISQSVYGEEDYIGMDLEEYISERRKEKVRLAFLRLLHPRELAPVLKEELEALLRGFTRGSGRGETWQVLLGEYGDDREYYHLFAELSCINEENFDGILRDIGQDYPEMKAFFLKYWEEQHSAEDFFRGLEL